MKLEIRNTHEFNRAICIDIDFLETLQSIILLTCDEIEVHGIQKNNSKITFDSINELTQFENSQQNRLVSLYVKGRMKFREMISIKFELKGGIVTTYSTTVSYAYAFNSEEDESIFLLKFKSLLKSATCRYWLVGKCGSYLLLALVCCPYTIFLLINGTIINSIKNNEVITYEWLFFSIISILFIGGLRIFDRKIWLSLFEPIAFRIGKGVQEFCRKERIRQYLFWSVLVAFIIGLLLKFI